MIIWYTHSRIGKKTGGRGNKRTRGGNASNRIAEIGQNTEKSLGDLMKLTVTQTPVKDHQLTLVKKLARHT